MNIPTIIHHCFDECQDFTLDQYWKDIFFLCACGKFPKGCRYDPATHTLYTRIAIAANKTKGEAISLPKSSEEIYTTLLDIFKNKFGMFSSRDLQIKKDELFDIQEQQKINMDCEWKKLKPRSIKDFLISNYVSDMQIKHNLTQKESKILLTTIGIWMQMKKITSEDILYEDYTIKDIRGIRFLEEERKWVNDNSPKLTYKPEKTSKPQKLDQCLDRFIREHKNRQSRF